MSKPEPFVAVDVDISGMPGFMMDVQRLFSSELWAISTGDEFKAAMALWGRAWMQVPAGSLPNDERILAAFSGAGAKWRKVRDVALRGFVECSDGRLYHKTLCEDVNVAWDKRLKFRERTAAATAARSARNGQRNVERNDHPVDGDSGQGTETIRNSGGGLETRATAAAAAVPEIEERRAELVRRLNEATGWKLESRNIGQIEKLIADGVSLHDRIIPIAKAVAAELARQGKPAPDTWAYLAKPIADPARVATPAAREVELVWIRPDTPEWQSMLAAGKPESLLRSWLRKSPDGVDAAPIARSALPVQGAAA